MPLEEQSDEHRLIATQYLYDLKARDSMQSFPDIDDNFLFPKRFSSLKDGISIEESSKLEQIYAQKYLRNIDAAVEGILEGEPYPVDIPGLIRILQFRGLEVQTSDGLFNNDGPHVQAKHSDYIKLIQNYLHQFHAYSVQEHFASCAASSAAPVSPSAVAAPEPVAVPVSVTPSAPPISAAAPAPDLTLTTHPSAPATATAAASAPPISAAAPITPGVTKAKDDYSRDWKTHVGSLSSKYKLDFGTNAATNNGFSVKLNASKPTKGDKLIEFDKDGKATLNPQVGKDNEISLTEQVDMLVASYMALHTDKSKIVEITSGNDPQSNSIVRAIETKLKAQGYNNIQFKHSQLASPGRSAASTFGGTPSAVANAPVVPSATGTPDPSAVVPPPPDSTVVTTPSAR